MSSQSELSHHGILTSALGAFVALLAVIVISRFFLSGSALPFLVASMGATAVILFVIPSSPMSKPWSVFGSQVISASAGVFCYQTIDSIVWAVPATIALAILLMLYLRCLHPPGGATSLLAVAGSEEVHDLGYQFVLTPVAINTVVILLIAYLFHTVIKQIQIKQTPVNDRDWWSTLPADRAGMKVPFNRIDLSSAMQTLDTYVDVTKRDLLKIYTLAAKHARSRNIENSLCREIMNEDVVKAEFGTELQDVWAMIKENDVRSVPVVDRVNHLVGIVTVSDFIEHAGAMGEGDEAERMKRLVERTEGMNSSKPEVAGQIMSKPVFSLGPNDTLATAITLLQEKHIHHLPVVNDKNKLIGMVSHTDLPAVSN